MHGAEPRAARPRSAGKKNGPRSRGPFNSGELCLAAPGATCLMLRLLEASADGAARNAEESRTNEPEAGGLGGRRGRAAGFRIRVERAAGAQSREGIGIRADLYGAARERIEGLDVRLFLE